MEKSNFPLRPDSSSCEVTHIKMEIKEESIQALVPLLDVQKEEHEDNMEQTIHDLIPRLDVKKEEHEIVLFPGFYTVPSTMHIPLLWLKHAPVRRNCCLGIIIMSCSSLIFFVLLVYMIIIAMIRSNMPIVGWEVNRSRDMRLYILPDNVTAMIPGPEQCSFKLFLLVVVFSAVDNFQARVAIRKTWASAQVISKVNASVRVLFLLGDPNNHTLQELVEEESYRYKDVIQEGFIDSYYNLTLKAVMILKWVHAHCTQASFIMKTDDDMFLNVENLVRLLQTTGGPGLLMGSLRTRNKPITDPISKWYCPRYMFAERVYPNFVTGAGYVMAADVADRLYQAALLTPFFHLEDVFLNGMCASRAGIIPRGDPSFSDDRLCKMNLCLFCNRSMVVCGSVHVGQPKKLWVKAYSSEFNCAKLKCTQQ